MSWWMDKVTLANDYLSKAKDFCNPKQVKISMKKKPNTLVVEKT